MNLKSKFRRFISWPDLLAVGMIVAVGLLFFWRAFSPPGVFVAGDTAGSDFEDFFLPSRIFLTKTLRDSQLPLWSANAGFGFPMLAEGQIQAFFPSSVLSLFLPAAGSYNLSIFLCVVGVGLSTYLFARKGLQLRPLTALFAATAFAFGAPITMRWKHLSLLSVVALFPLEMLLVKRLFWRGGDKGDRGDRGCGGFVVGMGAILGLQLFAGHPQMFFYCLVVTGLYFAFNLIGALFSRERLREAAEPLITNREISLFLRYAGVFVAASLLGLALGAAQLGPTLELLGESGRSQGLSYAGSLAFPFFFKHLTTLLVPFSFGDPSKWAPYLTFDSKVLVWEICAYSGLLAAIFGALKVASFLSRRGKGRSGEVGFFIFLLVFSVLEARFNFLYFFPLAAAFRVSARFVIFISFSMSLLAALFLEEFVFRQVVPKWRLLQKPLVAARAPQVALLLLVFFSAADLYFNFGKYNQTVVEKDWQRPPPTVDFLRDNLGQDFRILPLRESYLAFSTYLKQRGWRNDPGAFLDGQKLIPYSRGLVWDIPSASIYTGISVFRARRFLEFANAGFVWNDDTEELNTVPGVAKLLSYGAIEYVLSPLRIANKALTPVLTTDLALTEHQLYVYRVENALPRANFVSQARFVPSEVAALNFVVQGLVDPTTTVVLEGEETEDSRRLMADSRGSGPPPVATTTILTNEDQQVVIQVSAPRDGYLVLADTYYPGWKAYVSRVGETEGRGETEVEILRANYNFRAVPISQGDHLVTFSYEPESFRQGLAISTVALGVLVGLGVYLRLRRGS